MDYICKSLLNIFLISTSWGAGRLTQSNKFQKSSYSEGEKGVGWGDRLDFQNRQSCLALSSST